MEWRTLKQLKLKYSIRVKVKPQECRECRLLLSVVAVDVAEYGKLSKSQYRSGVRYKFLHVFK